VPNANRCAHCTTQDIECIKHSGIKRCAACKRRNKGCVKYVGPKLEPTSEDEYSEVQAAVEISAENLNRERRDPIRRRESPLTEDNVEETTQLKEKNTHLRIERDFWKLQAKKENSSQQTESNTHLRIERDFWKLQAEKLGYPPNVGDD
jgi:hypothetical protein